MNHSIRGGVRSSVDLALMLDRNMLSAGVFGRHFGLFKSVEPPEAIPAATLIVPFPGVNCLNGQGAAATITGSLRQYRPRRGHPATTSGYPHGASGRTCTIIYCGLVGEPRAQTRRSTFTALMMPEAAQAIRQRYLCVEGPFDRPVAEKKIMMYEIK
jgi:hypothetical protein